MILGYCQNCDAIVVQSMKTRGPFPFSTSLVSYGTAHRQGALATGGELCNLLQGNSVWYDVTVAFLGFLPEVIQISGRV